MTSENIIKKIKSAAKYTFVFKVLTQASGFIATILIVRALSEHDFGIYNLLYSLIALIGMVASFGIGNTLQRYIPEYYQKGEFKIAHNLFRTVSFIRLLTNILIFGLFLLLWENIAPFFKLQDYRTHFILFTLVISLHMQRGILEICLGAYFLHKYTKAIGFIFPLIKAAGYALIIIFDKNIWHALAVDALAYFIVYIILQMVYFDKIPINSGDIKKFSKLEKKRLWRYSLFYNFNDAGAGMLQSNFDNFILVIFLNPVAVGAYSFCSKLTKQIESMLPLNYFLEVIRPAFFTTDRDSKKNHNLFFQSLTKINCLLTIPFFFFLTLYSPDLIQVLFGGKFIEYSTVWCAIFFFSVLNSFQIPLGLVAQLEERADIILYSKLFAVYNIVGDIILIKLFGIWGAVMATGTANLGKNLFIWYFLKNEVSFRGLQYFLTKIFFYWLILSGLLFGVNTLFKLQNTTALISGAILFALAFFTQFKLDFFTPLEKKIFRKTIGDRKPGRFIKKLVLNGK